MGGSPCRVERSQEREQIGERAEQREQHLGLLTLKHRERERQHRLRRSGRPERHRHRHMRSTQGAAHAQLGVLMQQPRDRAQAARHAAAVLGHRARVRDERVNAGEPVLGHV